jgi:diacylglycerol kinase family enzyme
MDGDIDATTMKDRQVGAAVRERPGGRRASRLAAGRTGRLRRPLIQIVVTPGSGNGRTLDTACRLQHALRSRGWRTRLETFTDLRGLIRWGATCGRTFSHLVCVGGDATLSAAAQAAVRHSVPFVPVPRGFGNLFARAFGHPDRVEAVVGLLEDGEVIRIDAGMVNGEIFLSHLGYGLLAQVQAAVEKDRTPPKSRLLRHLAYYRTAGRFLLDMPLPPIRVAVDGTVIAKGAAVVTVANVEAYGGILSLTPGASPIDGLLDVFVLPQTTKTRLWSRLFQLMLRLPSRWNEVLVCRGRRVSVAVRGKRPQAIEVLPRAVPLLVPRGCGERLERGRATLSGQIEAAPDRLA